MENTTNSGLSHQVIGALADAFGKDFTTIKRWIKNESILLTTDTAKNIFSRFGVTWDPKINFPNRNIRKVRHAESC